MAYTTTQQIPAPVSTNIGPNGEGTNQVNIFIGGALDNSGNYNVEHSDSLTGKLPAQGDGTYGSNYYFTHSDEDKIDALINSLPDGTTINVIGHSWGGDTAAHVAMDNAGTDKAINTLITIDPVTTFGSKPNFDALSFSANNWVNVSSTGNSSGGVFSGATNGNWAAEFLNGHWGNGPDGHATVFIPAAQNHAEFDNMMQTSKNGKTAQQILNGN